MGVANHGELNNSPCYADFRFCRQKTKKTKEELEKDIPENCHVVRTNSVVRIAKF